MGIAYRGLGIFFVVVVVFILVAVLLKLETITQFYFSSDSYHSY